MKAQEVINLYYYLKKNGLTIWIDGGWGIDALLGKQTRPHEDLDIAIDRKDFAKLRSLLKEYHEKKRDDTSDWNFVLEDGQGNQIDVHVFEFDDKGNNVYGIEYPQDSLTGTGKINGQTVNCIAAEWVIKFHSNYKPKEKDLKDIKALCNKFGLKPPESYKNIQTLNNKLVEEIKIEIKKGSELTDKEIDDINNAKEREWQIPPINKNQKPNTIFFLLKSAQGEILAQGELIEINGVLFNQKEFNILGIGGIIANIKGQGYGRKIMTAIKKYLKDYKKTGVGFTNKPIFYQKCGYKIDKDSIKRFVYMKDDERIINTTDEYVIYIDSDDKFMESVLKNPVNDVLLPRNPDW